MRNVGLEEAQAGIKIARRNISNLRYADDTTFMSESEKKLNYSNKNVLLIEFFPELPHKNSAWSTSWFQSDNVLSREPTNAIWATDL